MYDNYTGANGFIGQLVSQGKISSRVGSILESLQSKHQTPTESSNQFSDVYNQAVNNQLQSNTSYYTPSVIDLGMTAYDNIFNEAASTYNIPVTLLKAVARAESNFNPQVISSSGAQGIMQLMPATAAALGVANPMDPQQNIMGGAKYLAQMLERFGGNVEKALAAYNAGAASVEKYDGIPPFKETQNYVQKVLEYMKEGTLLMNASASAAANSSLSSGLSSSLNGLNSNQVSSSVLLKLLQQQNNAAMSLGQIGEDKENGYGMFSY